MLVASKKKLTTHQLLQAFHDSTSAVGREAVPKRWIDLLRHLDEKEREASRLKPEGRAP